MEDTSFFDQIPDRILLEIFKLLDLKTLATARCVTRRFYDVIATNSKYLPKPTKSFKILAAKDDLDNPTVEFQCNDCEEYVICCSSAEIVAKPPFYIDYGVNLETDGHFNKRWKMEHAFRHSFSRTVGDGREFDESHPLPATSLANSFEEALNFYLSHFHISSLFLNEYYRNFTAEEMNLILQCVKVNRTTVTSMSKQTEVLDDVLIDLIRRTNCSDFTFCNSSEEQITADDENSVERRITELSCERMYIDTGLISVQKFLELIQQWSDGNRAIEQYKMHSEKDLDWFVAVSNLRNIEVNSEPEDIIWSMNADVHLKTFCISRKTDEERLDFYYWDIYLEIKNYKPE